LRVHLDERRCEEKSRKQSANRELDFHRKLVHSVASDRKLIVASVLYWGGMASVPLLFFEQIEGGAHATVPTSSALYSTVMCLLTLLIEL